MGWSVFINKNLYKYKITTHTVNACDNENCINMWLRRLWHRKFTHIKQLVHKNLAIGFQLYNCKYNNICETCIECKLSDSLYESFRTTQAIELVHAD